MLIRRLAAMLLIAGCAAAQNAAPTNAPVAPSAQNSAFGKAPAAAPNGDGMPSPHKFDYSKSAPSFPNLLAPYEPRHVPPPTMTNSQRTMQLVRDGKLYMSLNDAIALALENNLDLGIARYNLLIADTDLLRTKAGAQARGVATGLVQGTAGGGIGGIGAAGAGAGAGGTAAGAGGSGSGAGGQVLSTLGAGSQVDSFDPLLTGNLRIEHGTFPVANTITTGIPSVTQNTGTANFSYAQAFPTGTSLQV